MGEGGGGAQCGTKWRPGYCLIDQSLMTSSRLRPFYRYDNAELVHVVVQSILATVITKLILGILIFLTQASKLQEQSRNIYRRNITWKSFIFFKHSVTLISKCWHEK